MTRTVQAGMGAACAGIQRRNRDAQQVFYCLLTGFFLGVVSASSARRKFWRWREKYKLVRERLAKTFNAAIGVLTASKNGGYALTRTGDPIIMSMTMLE